MIVALLIVVAVLLLFLAGQGGIMILMLKRNQRLEFQVEDCDRIAFHDIATMFRMHEQINSLRAERDAAHVCIEMLVDNEIKSSKNFEASLEMVLNGA